jgi:hypothetical protein
MKELFELSDSLKVEMADAIEKIIFYGKRLDSLSNRLSDYSLQYPKTNPTPPKHIIEVRYEGATYNLPHDSVKDSVQLAILKGHVGKLINYDVIKKIELICDGFSMDPTKPITCYNIYEKGIDVYIKQ